MEVEGSWKFVGGLGDEEVVGTERRWFGVGVGVGVM